MRRLLFIVGVLLSGAVFAQDATVFEIAMGFDVRAKGTPFSRRTDWTMQVTLSGRNTVTTSSNRRFGAISENFARTTALGASAQGEMSEWRVVDPSTLRATIEGPTSIRTMTIRVSGRRCSLQVSDRLKPGARSYVYRRPDTGRYGEFERPLLAYAECTVR